MRILTEQELEHVYGGDTITAPLLPAVTVNASYTSNTYEPFALNNAIFGQASYVEIGGHMQVCYANSHPALPTLPTIAHIKCLTDHTDISNDYMVSSYKQIQLNAYLFTVTADTGDANMSNAYVQQSASTPSGYHYVWGGDTHTGGNYNSTTTFATAFVPYSGDHTYTDPILHTTNNTLAGPLTATEATIFTYAHEFAHENGVSDERTADGYGALAVYSYRANKAADDAACP